MQMVEEKELVTTLSVFLAIELHVLYYKNMYLSHKKKMICGTKFPFSFPLLSNSPYLYIIDNEHRSRFRIACLGNY